MSNLPEGAFLTSINCRECTVGPRCSVITINHNATRPACATSASTFNIQVDQRPSSSATSTASAPSTGVAEELTSMRVAEDVPTSTSANTTPKPAAPSSSVATAVPSRSATSTRRSDAAASFASSSSHTSTTPVTLTASLPAPPFTASVSSAAVSTSEAAARAPATTQQQKQPTSTTQRVQAPSIEATQGQEPKESLSNPVSAQPVSAESAAPATLPPAQLTPGTNPDSQNGSPARDPAPIPTGAASSSPRIGDGTPPTRTTLETSASAATSETLAAGTSAVSSITTIELCTTALGDPFAKNHSQDGKPVGERPGGSGNSENDPQDVSPAADNSSQSSHGLSTARIVGVAVGGVAALSLILLLLWLWRRRVAKKRQGTLPSSFSKTTRKQRDVDANELDGGAAGARTGTSRLAAALGFHGGRSRSPCGATDSPTVIPSRGTSQFLETAAVPWLDTSTATRPVLDVLTVKDRALDWWSRKAVDKDFNARVRVNRGGPPSADMAEKSSTYNIQPEFSARLAISFDDPGRLDPFSDAQATSSSAVYSTSQPTNAKPSNPFADPSTTQPRRHSRNQSQTVSVTYAPAIPPRTRGRSLSATVRASQYPPPAMASRPHSIHRDSLQSVEFFVDRRNKVRSDPFDLELESRMMPGATAVAQMPRRTAASPTHGPHTRPGSLRSSRYTSGVSTSDWSEAGADRGPRL
ncbi:Uncharacterized protein TPAR_03334 [Tolypocladium paradoxum]|uniref:Uncharacterized protein n=1 Tax=Tolypocladium paradoxum TaxID=94208 RepID=A0A2S4L203_9HYPO|nr:Uncharacterized protein TPAR_03334 [Tolypocladium paradoxum]